MILHGTMYLVRHLCRKSSVISDFFSITQERVLGQGLLFIEASRSHPEKTAFVRTPLDDRTARRLHTNIHKRRTPNPPTGFETIIPASERPQTQTLDRAATGIGNLRFKKRILRKL